MLKLFNQCPACGGPVIITECRCPACHLEMRGEFQPGKFSALSDDQLTFIQVFLGARGNLSEVERVLGISYPTIRNKLDEINGALDRQETSPAPRREVVPNALTANSEEEDRRAILQKVADGQLSAEEAAQILKSQQEG